MSNTSALDRKFNQDLIWNYMATVVMAVSGVLLNLVVVGVYGAAGLGVFSQVYAVYAITSQFATGGLHYSALKHVAEYMSGNRVDPGERAKAAWSAVAMAALLGLAVALAGVAAAPLIGRVMGSEAVGRGLRLAAPGLLFLALNKVLLGVLNGMRRMRAFALGQSLRYMLIIVLVGAAAALELPVHCLGAAFTVAEAALLLLVGAMVVHWVRPRWGSLSGAWLVRHAAFGLKGFLSPLIIEMNARVDVAMLGFFLSDREVGVYSFAAMVAEGFYNLLVVVRNNVNPLLVPLVMARRTDEIRAMFRRLAPRVYLGALIFALVVLALYRPGVRLVLGNGDFLESWSVMAVLFAGIVACSGYVPFSFILLQAGQPGRHTQLTAMSLMTNVCLNMALIPFLGNHGAALATAFALVLSVGYLNLMVGRRLGFHFGLPL